MKLNLLQLLSLTAISAAVVHLCLLNSDGDPYWRDGTLVFETPEVPAEYQLIESPVHLLISCGPSITFADGKDLFLRNFEVGWKQMRRRFYFGEDWANEESEFDFYDEYDLSKLRFRADWDQAAYAQHQGRLKCRQQIEQLRSQMAESLLKRKLAYSRHWQWVPGSLIIVLGFCGIVRVQKPESRLSRSWKQTESRPKDLKRLNLDLDRLNLDLDCLNLDLDCLNLDLDCLKLGNGCELIL